MKRVLAIGLTLMLASAVLAQEGDTDHAKNEIAKEVLAKAQGKWKTTIEWNDQKILSIKEIEGNKETISRIQGDKLLAQWTVDFEIANTHGLNIFTYRNMTFTHGPAKGRVNKGPFSYVFKIHDNEWHEFHGLMEDDQRAPNTTVYKRDDADDEDDDDEEDDDEEDDDEEDDDEEDDEDDDDGDDGN